MLKEIKRKRKEKRKDYNNENRKLLNDQKEVIEYLTEQTDLYLNDRAGLVKDSSEAKKLVSFNYKNFINIKSKIRYIWLFFYILISGYFHWLYLYDLSCFQETYYKLTGEFLSKDIKQISGKITLLNTRCRNVFSKRGSSIICKDYIKVEVDKKQLKLDNASEELYNNYVFKTNFPKVNIQNGNIVELAYIPRAKDWEYNYFFISGVEIEDTIGHIHLKVLSPISLFIVLLWFLIIQFQFQKKQHYINTHNPLYVRLAYVDIQKKEIKNRIYEVYANVYSLKLPNNVLLYFYGKYSATNQKFTPKREVVKKIYIFDKKCSSYYIR
ncbi:MAG: hypothetical protein ACI4V7_09885 [Succinivibrionaceae bacterium]